MKCNFCTIVRGNENKIFTCSSSSLFCDGGGGGDILSSLDGGVVAGWPPWAWPAGGSSGWWAPPGGNRDINWLREVGRKGVGGRICCIVGLGRVGWSSIVVLQANRSEKMTNINIANNAIKEKTTGQSL